MRSAIRMKPVRVQFRPTPSITIRESGTSVAAAIQNAADDGSPGTVTSPSSSSSSWETQSAPSSRREKRACDPSRIRSVWSRLGCGSRTIVSPSASSPAISTHDFTCALATGSSYSMPVSRLPPTLSGGSRPSRASTAAPIRASGSTTRSTGRLRIDSSPSSVQTPPGCPASHPGRSRSSVPELPTSSVPPVASSAPRRPTPRSDELPLLHVHRRAEHAQGGERRERVLGVQVVLDRHGLVAHRAEQRRAVRDRLVRGRA